MNKKVLVKHWRLIPRVRIINWKKEPYYNNKLWQRFRVQIDFGGRIVSILLKHYLLEFDFRRNWKEYCYQP